MIQKNLSLHENGRLTRYLVFSREEWAQLRDNTPLTLSEDSLKALRSLNDPISLQEVEHIYLPLSRLLQLYVEAVQKLYTVASTFLGSASAEIPYVVGIAGSVAVGKSKRWTAPLRPDSKRSQLLRNVVN